MTTIYSHRPMVGVSVAAHQCGECLIVVFCLAHDGTSKNGFYYPKMSDVFDRRRAIQILQSRISSEKTKISQPVSEFCQKNQSKHAMCFDTNISAGDFMKRFRKKFKPTSNEMDDTFCEVETNGEIEVRYRDRAENIVKKIRIMAQDIYNESISIRH